MQGGVFEKMSCKDSKNDSLSLQIPQNSIISFKHTLVPYQTYRWNFFWSLLEKQNGKVGEIFCLFCDKKRLEGRIMWVVIWHKIVLIFQFWTHQSSLSRQQKDFSAKTYFKLFRWNKKEKNGKKFNKKIFWSYHHTIGV